MPRQVNGTPVRKEPQVAPARQLLPYVVVRRLSRAFVQQFSTERAAEVYVASHSASECDVLTRDQYDAEVEAGVGWQPGQ